MLLNHIIQIFPRVSSRTCENFEQNIITSIKKYFRMFKRQVSSHYVVIYNAITVEQGERYGIKKNKNVCAITLWATVFSFSFKETMWTQDLNVTYFLSIQFISRYIVPFRILQITKEHDIHCNISKLPLTFSSPRTSSKRTYIAWFCDWDGKNTVKHGVFYFENTGMNMSRGHNKFTFHSSFSLRARTL